MTEHIVKSYEGQLQELTNTIIKMGALAESQFSNSMIALLKRDQDLADKVSGKDFTAYQKRFSNKFNQS